MGRNGCAAVPESARCSFRNGHAVWPEFAAKNNTAVRTHLQREIIEIGAVKLNRSNEIVDQFKCYVRPEYNTTIATFITRLTGISTADVEKGLSLPDAILLLDDWIDLSGKAKIYSWSNADLLQLQSECDYKQISIPDSLKDWQDFQKEYSTLMGEDVCHEQMALHRAAEQFGIVMDEKHSHSALYDAEITAELLIMFLTGEYRKQAEILRSTVKKDSGYVSFTIGDACGMVLQQLLYQFQSQPEFA